LLRFAHQDAYTRRADRNCLQDGVNKKAITTHAYDRDEQKETKRSNQLELATGT
jgi:hypothetical protein